MIVAASAFAGLAALLAACSASAAGGASVLGSVGVGPGNADRRHRLRDAFARCGASRFGRRMRRDRVVALCRAADSRWAVDQVVGAKLLGPAAVVVVALAAPAPVPMLAGPLALLAWRAPEMLLARGASRRLAGAAHEVPLFLDLLAVATSAGLAPQLAVRNATVPLDGPLADELRSAIRRTDLGRRWRDEVAAAAERLASPDLRRVAAVLGRSESLGSSLADEIARLATDVREERRSRAAERARTAPVKMLFPLVFLILPAFLLLTVVPVLLSTVRSIG
jgi:tight adherence protein C